MLLYTTLSLHIARFLYIADMAKVIKFGKGVNLVLNDYRYKKDCKCGSKHWRCVMVRQGCKARLHTVGDEDNIDVINQTPHDHLADADYILGCHKGSPARLSERTANNVPFIIFIQVYCQ